MYDGKIHFRIVSNNIKENKIALFYQKFRIFGGTI